MLTLTSSRIQFSGVIYTLISVWRLYTYTIKLTTTHYYTLTSRLLRIVLISSIAIGWEALEALKNKSANENASTWSFKCGQMSALFTGEAYFCPKCGSILPLPEVCDIVKCRTCSYQQKARRL